MSGTSPWWAISYKRSLETPPKSNQKLPYTNLSRQDLPCLAGISLNKFLFRKASNESLTVRILQNLSTGCCTWWWGVTMRSGASSSPRGQSVAQQLKKKGWNKPQWSKSKCWACSDVCMSKSSAELSWVLHINWQPGLVLTTSISVLQHSQKIRISGGYWNRGRLGSTSSWNIFPCTKP